VPDPAHGSKIKKIQVDVPEGRELKDVLTSVSRRIHQNSGNIIMNQIQAGAETKKT
jgi:hypothetical protein